MSNHSLLKRVSVLCLGENLEHLRHVGLGVAHDVVRAQRRTRGRTPGGIANHAGEVANQKDDGVAEILKMLELAQQHGVAEMEIGRSGIKAGFHSQRLAGSERFFQLGAKLGLFHDFRGALLDVGELFVDGSERWHRVNDYSGGARRFSR